MVTAMFLPVLLLTLPLLSPAYEATWESLDSRPLPTWYEDAKFGIFLHWGVFSVPAFGSEWFWYYWRGAKDPRWGHFVNITEGPRFSYQDYAHRFDASLYSPEYWADVFAQAGAQYVVLTSKHHEGYCMWDSRDVPTTWGWNAMEVGPRRDVLKDLAVEVRKTTSPQTGKPVKFGIYHSLLEWYNPLYMRDQTNQYETNDFPRLKTMPELYDIVEKIQPELIWSDGNWDAHSDYWMSKEFLAWLANNSTVKDTVVWNDRWGNETRCQHGSYWNCDDKYQPNELNNHKWESCYTVDKTSWGFNRNATLADYHSTTELIHTMIHTVALNGNFLLNVGPKADGTLPVAFVDRLLEIGRWLTVNGEAIYASRPWPVAQQENTTYYTMSQDARVVYVLVTEWHNQLQLNAPSAKFLTRVTMLGYEGDDLVWNDSPTKGVIITVPPLTPSTIPCQHAWVFVLEFFSYDFEREETI